MADLVVGDTLRAEMAADPMFDKLRGERFRMMKQGKKFLFLFFGALLEYHK